MSDVPPYFHGKYVVRICCRRLRWGPVFRQTWWRIFERNRVFFVLADVLRTFEPMFGDHVLVSQYHGKRRLGIYFQSHLYICASDVFYFILLSKWARKLFKSFFAIVQVIQYIYFNASMHCSIFFSFFSIFDLQNNFSCCITALSMHLSFTEAIFMHYQLPITTSTQPEFWCFTLNKPLHLIFFMFAGNQFSRLVEHALRSYLAYADCTQVCPSNLVAFKCYC